MVALTHKYYSIASYLLIALPNKNHYYCCCYNYYTDYYKSKTNNLTDELRESQSNK